MEIKGEGLPTVRKGIETFRESGHMTTGRRASDQRIMFVAGTVPLDRIGRGTFFLFAKGFDATIGFALRRWAEKERETFPGQKFFTISEGDHPMKYRFLKIAGCEHEHGPVFTSVS